VYKEKDYWKLICTVHKTFNQDPPIIINEYSQNEWAIKGVNNHSPFDVIYVDGDHSYDGCMADLINYSPMVDKGGYLVIDDAGRYFDLPDGMYSGHEAVSNAVRDWDKEGFEFQFSLCHIVVYRKK
jgi:cephalosporin hydroxylase